MWRTDVRQFNNKFIIIRWSGGENLGTHKSIYETFTIYRHPFAKLIVAQISSVLYRIWCQVELIQAAATI